MDSPHTHDTPMNPADGFAPAAVRPDDDPGAAAATAATPERGGYPSQFGRGWIPVGRDIGLPGEVDLASLAAFAVAPAEAGAYSGAPDHGGRGFDEGRLDGPLPPPGRREEFYPERVEGQGRRQEDWGRRDLRSAAGAYHFTPPRRAQFLHYLAIEGSARAACARVGISPQAAYVARRRDAAFRAGWDAALVLARPHAEEVLANRALDGVREAIWYRGELVGERVRFDGRLLLAHLARLDARAGDELAAARAQRFDELLALVAGAAFDPALRDVPSGADYTEPDPLLPVTRERHSDHAAAAVVAEIRWGSGAEPHPDDVEEEDEALSPLELAEQEARECAEAEWDGWGDHVGAVVAALDAGAPVSGEYMAAGRAAGADLPYEVKSLDGAAAAAGRACRDRRKLSAPRHDARGKPWAPRGAGEEGADLSPRTPSLPSTPAEFGGRGLERPTMSRPPCGGRADGPLPPQGRRRGYGWQDDGWGIVESGKEHGGRMNRGKTDTGKAQARISNRNGATRKWRRQKWGRHCCRPHCRLSVVGRMMAPVAPGPAALPRDDRPR